MHIAFFKEACTTHKQNAWKEELNDHHVANVPSEAFNHQLLPLTHSGAPPTHGQNKKLTSKTLQGPSGLAQQWTPHSLRAGFSS